MVLTFYAGAQNAHSGEIVPGELVQDRRGWGASIRDLVNSIADAAKRKYIYSTVW